MASLVYSSGSQPVIGRTMYIKHFRLSEPPFSLTPDPRYFFMSERHREGLAYLIYGIQQPGGFVLLTGEVGSGKTTLCRCLIKELPPDTEIALILNPRLTVLELLASICDELRISYPPKTQSIKVLIDALNQRLLENHAQRKRTVIVIDEAQNLSGDVLEQIRLLTNLETAKEKLLQIILIGQPELLSVLKRQELRQLAQRITARYHLRPMSREETSAYIRHRLLIAGRSDSVFTPFAIRLIYRLSSGVPRIINMICDRALLGAYANDRRDVPLIVVGQASRETQGLGRRWIPVGLAACAVLLIVLSVGMALYLKPDILPGLHRNAASAAVKPVAPPPLKPAAEIVPDGLPEKTAQSNLKATVSKETTSIAAGRLLEVLKDPLVNATTSSSFTTVYSTWGVHVSLRPSDLGCQVGREHGFDCLYQSGDWSRLRRFDLPTMLEMQMPDGRRKYLALVGLTETTATLAIGKQEYTFALAEIDALWSGAFILIWKPPFTPQTLSVGSHGKEVAWVIHALNTLERKAPDSAAPDIFDNDLRQRVIAFQRSRSLIQDGAVGSETLVRLVLALDSSSAPSISNQNR
jgi:general secretion pathway protein A